MTTLSTARPSLAAGPTARRGLVVAGAALAGLATWGVLTALGLELVVEPGTSAAQTITAVPVLVAALAAGLAGWGVLALLERYAGARGVRVWRLGAAATFLLSLVPALAPSSTGTATRVSLVVLHAVVAAVVVLGLTRTSRTS